MAETELETRMQGEVRKLQVQINKQSAYIQRLHGLIAQPSTLARVRKEMSRVSGDLLGTTNQVTVTGGTDAVLKSDDVTLSLPQNIHSGASPTFAGMTLTAFSGLVRAVAGVLSAITTSADLATVISDETGSGKLVFADSPTLKTPIITDLPIYINNAAAAADLPPGGLYRTGGDPDTVCVVH